MIKKLPFQLVNHQLVENLWVQNFLTYSFLILFSKKNNNNNNIFLNPSQDVVDLGSLSLTSDMFTHITLVIILHQKHKRGYVDYPSDHAYTILSLLTSPIFPRFTRRSAFARQRMEDDHNHEQGEFSRTIEQSFSQSAVSFESVPASRSAVKALEKFRYERSSEDEDNPKCMVCMEEVMSGSYLTRMPCSHVYHFGCIFRWLHNNHTCPLCRFKLPIK